MIHNSLQNYYAIIFAMVQHHKYSITEIENMIPFERDIYVEMLTNYLQEVEKSKQKNG
jgi:hypothetical protein